MILPADGDSGPLSPMEMVYGKKVFFSKAVGNLEEGSVITTISQEDADRIARLIAEAEERAQNETPDGTGPN